MSGIVDASLQSRLLAAPVGAAVVCAAFLLAGHGSHHALRWLLAPLLLMHLLVAAFRFGSILPVAMACILIGAKINLSNPYDGILGIKLLSFAFLMGIAALNKFRLGPALATVLTGLCGP